jgi:hypothetical protein
MPEQIPKNFSVSSLVGSILSGATSLTVANELKFPGVPTFRLLIDSELIKVTGVAGPNFTVVRGDGGTTAAPHSNGTTVQGVYTAEAIAALVAPAPTVGTVGATFASNFTSSSAGRLFLPNDAPWMAIDDGAAINYLGHPQYRRLYPMDDSLFSWVNQGSATVSTANGIVTLTSPANASESCNLRVKSRFASTWTVEAMVIADIYPANFNNAGLFAYDSISGRLVLFRFAYNTGVTSLVVANMNSVTSYNADVASFLLGSMQGIPPHWLKMQDNGTNLIFSFSLDGITYRPLATVGRTAFLTNGADKVGIFTDPVNATFGCGVSCYSWKET